jgi:hypothetical protein
MNNGPHERAIFAFDGFIGWTRPKQEFHLEAESAHASAWLSCLF